MLCAAYLVSGGCQLGPSAVALAAHTQQTARRMLVDEYDRQGNGYVLSSAATELAFYLHKKALKVALVPDVPAAVAAAAAAGHTGRPTTAGILNSVAAAAGLRSMQSTNSVLMVAPTAFGFNEQAAQDNSFMHAAEQPQEHSSLTARVCAEFAELHRQLTDVAGRYHWQGKVFACSQADEVCMLERASMLCCAYSALGSWCRVLYCGSLPALLQHLPQLPPCCRCKCEAVPASPALTAPQTLCSPTTGYSTHAAGEAAGGVGAATLVCIP